MTEQMGTLRPVRQREIPNGQAIRYEVTPIGDITATTRFREIEDLGLLEVLDETRIPFVADADGFGLFTETGELLAWWQMVAATTGEELRLSPGWGFRAHGAIDITGRTREVAATG